MFDTDCTLFSRHYDAETRTDKWEKSLIKGVHWEEDTGSSIEKTGVSPSNSITVYIPFSTEISFKVNDKIAKGISENIDIKSSFTITSVKKYDFGNLKHWEVKCE